VRLTEHSFGNGSFQTERIADGKDRFAYGEFFIRSKNDRGDFGFKIVNFQHGKVVEGGGGHNFHIFMHDPPQDLVFLKKLGDRDFLFAGNDVKVRDQITIFIDKESRAESGCRFHEHHRRGIKSGSLCRGKAIGHLHRVQSVGIRWNRAFQGFIFIRRQNFIVRNPEHIEAQIEYGGIIGLFKNRRLYFCAAFEDDIVGLSNSQC